MSFPDSEMHETASVRPKLGNSAYGPTYSDPTSIRCYVEPGFKRVTNAQGAEVVSSLMLICPAGTSILAESEVTFEDRIYNVIDVQPLKFQGVAHHVEVYLQSTVGVTEVQS